MERFAGLNFYIFWSFQEYRESFSVSIYLMALFKYFNIRHRKSFSVMTYWLESVKVYPRKSFHVYKSDFFDLRNFKKYIYVLLSYIYMWNVIALCVIELFTGSTIILPYLVCLSALFYLQHSFCSSLSSSRLACCHKQTHSSPMSVNKSISIFMGALVSKLEKLLHNFMLFGYKALHVYLALNIQQVSKSYFVFSFFTILSELLQ